MERLVLLSMDSITVPGIPLSRCYLRVATESLILRCTCYPKKFYNIIDDQIHVQTELIKFHYEYEGKILYSYTVNFIYLYRKIDYGGEAVRLR